MKKLKEKFSRYLAVILTLALVLQPGMTALAEKADAGTWKETALTGAAQDKATDSDAEEDEDEEADEEFDEEDLENDLATASDADEELEDDFEDEELELATPSDISLFSFMPPVEELSAYVYLNDYPEDKLDAVPVELILSRMQDREGNNIEVPDEGKIVWTYYEDKDGELIPDEAHAVERDGTVDLSSKRKRPSVYVDILLGSGQQLDMESIRYNTTIYLGNRLRETLKAELIRTDGAYPGEVDEPGFLECPSPLSREDVLVTRMNCYVKDHQDGDSYELKLISKLRDENRSGMEIKAYPLKEFLDAYQNGQEAEGEITEQLLELETAEGYAGSYQPAASLEAPNVFCIVYSDAETGKIYHCRAYEVVILSGSARWDGEFYTVEDNKMVPVTEERDYQVQLDERIKSFDVELNLEQDYFGTKEKNTTNLEDYELLPGYSINGTYYFVLQENEQIDRVFYGRYHSLEEAEAAGAKDITGLVLPKDKTAVPYGYRITETPEDGYLSFYITVFLKNGNYRIQLEELYGGEEELELDDKPLVNCVDPYLQMKRAAGYWDALVVANNSECTMDTYYGYGYQTVFLADQDADLEHLKPEFYNPEEVTIHSGTRQESGVSEKDFSDGPVAYQAHIGDKKRNYQVTFAKKQNGPSLFVNGPEKREVFLTKYFGYHHDVMIANIGDAELTGLKVELLDAQHVKLDDYWVVGGEGNERLGAFTDTRVDREHVDLANIAKVRLVPDGEGELSGTLVISADGQEPVTIELQGYASNPQITSDGLGDAVKYVPYSYMIATSNMYYEVQEQYELTSGTLPRGLELKKGTGEIYGVPLETGVFNIQVKVTYQDNKFSPSYRDLTLIVKENTNANVYNASDDGYEIEEHIGTETAAGSHDYLLTETGDQLYVSAGVIGEFVDLWLNGEKLTDGVDYTKVSGSTRMTVRSQTFQNKGVKGTNTIAAEFRTGSGEVKTLRRTSQNFRMENKKPSGSSGGNSSDRDSSDNSSTANQTAAEGYSDSSWNKDENGWRCKNPDGSWLTNTWKQLPYQGTVNWYYFDENGYMALGWLNHNGRTYYCNMGADGVFGAMSTGWKYIDNFWYYFEETVGEQEGAMKYGGWSYLPYLGTTEWYYFNEKGQMGTGWLTDAGKYYYLYPVADGTRGRMLTGWQQIDGNWYYFYGPDEALYGAMAANTRIGEYRVGSNGARTE